MATQLDLQLACSAKNIPSQAQFQQWLDCVLLSDDFIKDLAKISTKNAIKIHNVFEVTIRLVDIAESQTLNHQYRNKNKPTNVLSFPFEVPDEIELNLLGDLVICADIVENEAKEQNKTINDHWAHMVIHGCLHLLGFDHISDSEAEIMESIEINSLAKLGITNPYQN